MNKQLLFNNNLKLAHLPVDLNTAAITGARVAVGKGEKIAIVCAFGDSTAALVQLTLNQHTLISGGSSKVLPITNKYYHKADTATSFTEVVPTVAASVYDVSSVFASAEGILVLEVLQEDLDVTNGYAFLSVDIADSTAAKIGSTVYLIMNADYCPAYSEAL